MILEFETQVSSIPDYSELIALCVDIFSKNTDRHFQEMTVSIAIVSENTIQDLNARYRQKNAVTDVLSFPLWNEENIQSFPEQILGEIMICYAKAHTQALYLNHSIEYEIATLCLHGLCHLVGYDHQTDEDYETMKEKETYLIQQVQQYYSFS